MSEPTDDDLRDQHQQLLEELRAVIPGAEVLFAFLLTAPFSERFDRLDPRQRATYLAVFLAAGLALVLLLAPAVFHRVRFRQGDKEAMLRAGNVQTLAALVVMSFCIPGAVFLVTDIVHGFGWAVPSGTAALVVVAAIWWAVPVRRRLADRPGGPRSPS